ncbi:MAG: FxDxF family PEP-CTERM protein [Duganella sp.]
MKNMLKAAIFGALIASAGIAPVAYAADPVVIPSPVGALSQTTESLTLRADEEGGFGAFFGHVFTTRQAGVSTLNKTFSNLFTFTVGDTSQTSGAISASFTRTQDLVINSFDVYTSGGTLVIKGDTEGISTHTQENDNWFLPENSFLTAGNYYLKVTGQVLGAQGGTYGGSMNITPVPEAETYAMLLAGLGLVGFVGRRKAAKKAA